MHPQMFKHILQVITMFLHDGTKHNDLINLTQNPSLQEVNPSPFGTLQVFSST